MHCYASTITGSMWMNKHLALSLVFVSVWSVAPSVAQAAERAVVIRSLGHAPVLGRLRSTADFQRKVHDDQRLWSAAADQLGLTASQYARMDAAIAARRVRWVTLPRHLDEMTWSDGHRAYLLRNVFIPAGTEGWEVSLRDGRRETDLYVPAACGNLSVVRRLLPQPKPKARPLPVPTPYPTPSPRPIPVPTPAPTLPPVIPPPPQTIVQRRTVVVPFLLFLTRTINNTINGPTPPPPLPPPSCDPGGSP